MDDDRFRVLIIDDNEMTRSLLHLLVQGERFNVVGCAASATSGLRDALALKPDIICLDIQMPDGDGLDLLEVFSHRLPESIVLMVTACNDLATVRSALDRGAKGFVLKPFASGTVLDSLDGAVQLLVRRQPG